ncbi:alanine racemase [Psittacicella gerlachiana]|uniref:Alanine racemase n=1 Tax=Psittacicella gerlachiana TaxID=2028574 RepID=A0A3A1Y1L0_9GAMM|nr:alanine racemase [Psittacicella gerlachiana]RIY32123.1 alanine racemase [Psittacicella gerlachiana]
MKYPKAIIETKALKHNVEIIRKLAPNSKICAIVKANAYGHGLIEVARTLLNHVEGVGVARIAEAERLRDAGINNDIILLEGFLGAAELLKLNELKLSTAVHCYEQLELIEKYAPSLNKLKVWLKFNTGMNRLGLDADEAREVKLRLEALDCIEEINLMTHFANADDPKNNYTNLQLENFNRLNEELKLKKSISASSGVLFFPQTRAEWIRPGIIIYGISPSHESIEDYGFIPVMNLETIITNIFKLEAGKQLPQSNFISSQDNYIGVIALGTGDGYPAQAPEGTPFLINGRRVELLGKVGVDFIYVNLGNQLQDKIGDKVTIFGKGLPVEVVAKHINVITYELTTKLTTQTKHEYIIN